MDGCSGWFFSSETRSTRGRRGLSPSTWTSSGWPASGAATAHPGREDRRGAAGRGGRSPVASTHWSRAPHRCPPAGVSGPAACPRESRVPRAPAHPRALRTQLCLFIPGPQFTLISKERGEQGLSVGWLWSQPTAPYVTRGDKDNRNRALPRGPVGAGWASRGRRGSGGPGGAAGACQPRSEPWSPRSSCPSIFESKIPSGEHSPGTEAALWSEGLARLSLGCTGCCPGLAQGRWTSPALPCRYHHTTSVIGLYGLREALALIAEEVRGQAGRPRLGGQGGSSPAGAAGVAWQ